ncbi:branched chain amino acid aminotransferase [soil metagenome]|jgi:hypothetical protein
MWSGPRTISTTLLRAWGNRDDTVVVDEPLYAHYLATTGVDHPGRAEVIAAHDPDWRRVVARLTAPPPGGAAISYQKHMAHHLLPTVERGWLAELRHAFLIREPARMLASLVQVTPYPTLADTGLTQQAEILEAVTALGQRPLVLDAGDVLAAPEPMLRALCQRLGVGFSDRMLSWPAGPRDTDGVWARWWYDAVIASTGFGQDGPPARPLPGRLEPLLAACRPYYERLHRLRLRSDDRTGDAADLR